MYNPRKTTLRSKTRTDTRKKFYKTIATRSGSYGFETWVMTSRSEVEISVS
jgi:hypothetical protein